MIAEAISWDALLRVQADRQVGPTGIVDTYEGMVFRYLRLGMKLA